MKPTDLWRDWYELLADTADLLRDGIRSERPALEERVAAVVRLYESADHGRTPPTAGGGGTTTAAAGAAPARPGTAPARAGAAADGGTAYRAPPAAATGDGPLHSAEPLPPAAPAPERAALLERLGAAVRACTRCPLSLGRTNAVPGTGVLDPLVMVVGEGPGAEEDRTGLPFVGRAGQYLDKWLESIGLSRETNAYIANIVKCRPPGNRDPRDEETGACAPYLAEQIALVRPRLIMTAGRISMRSLTGTSAGITRIHGTFYQWRGIPVVPTFHPSAVLRNPQWRRPVWEDLKRIRAWLIDNAGHTAPPLPGSDGG